jgi:hypothetical protein
MQIAAILMRLSKYFFLGTVLRYAESQNISTSICINTMAQITIPSRRVDPTTGRQRLIFMSFGLNKLLLILNNMA